MFGRLIAFLRHLLGLDKGGSMSADTAQVTPSSVGLLQLIDVNGPYPSRPFADAPADGDGETIAMVHHFAGRIEACGVNADGRSWTTADHQAVFSLLGIAYGGNRTNFLLPDLRGRMAIGSGPNTGPVGRVGASSPTLTMTWMICVDGGIPPVSPCFGMLRLMCANFAPIGWRIADGAMLQVKQNPVLFGVIGNAFGGDGVTTFALPDLRGRTPIGIGTLPDGTTIAMGQKVGDGTAGNVPGLGLNIVISSMGSYPQPGISPFPDESLLGEVQVLAFNNAMLEEAWWVPANGALLPVGDDTLLFEVIGNAFGGDGVSTYALPDLRGKAITGRAL